MGSTGFFLKIDFLQLEQNIKNVKGKMHIHCLNSFSLFQTNKHILFLDTVRVIISRQNLARA